MRVDWGIICRYAEVNNGLATIVGAGIDNYTVAAVPAQIPLQLVVRVCGLIDANDHDLTVKLLDTQLSEVGTLSGTFGMEQNPNHPPGWEGAAILPVGVVLPANEVGTYTLHVSVDNHSVTLPFRVSLPA